MFGLVVLVVMTHLGMAAVDLPTMWGKRDRRRERWAAIALLLIGLLLATSLVLGLRPVPPMALIRAMFEPIGTPLFKVTR